MMVRIITTPAGEAPQHIREGWIGIEFEAKHTGGFGMGVLSMPRSFLGYIIYLLRGKGQMTCGYGVKAVKAIEILAEHNPQAATWWQENCQHLIKKNVTLLFRKEECQEI